VNAFGERPLGYRRAVTDFAALPDDLPVPEDDGAAAHLPGISLPHLELEATGGERVALDQLGVGRSIVYVYPLSGQPGVEQPDGWDDIPGARGCTAEACSFRDHYADLRAAGASKVYGLSRQDSAYQRELVERLHLPFQMLADPNGQLGEALALPRFEAGGHPLYKRLTLVLRDGVIEHVFYPVFPPDAHAAQVLQWLRDNPAD
jgi:peroxiredoxin